jgi:hypothetical protein
MAEPGICVRCAMSDDAEAARLAVSEGSQSGEFRADGR